MNPVSRNYCLGVEVLGQQIGRVPDPRNFVLLTGSAKATTARE